MFKWLEKASDLASRATGWAVILSASALVVSLLLSIFFRYVMGKALSWPEEISLMLFCWMVLLAGSQGVAEGFHVRLTIFTGRLPSPVRRVLGKLVIMAVGLFGALLAYSGMDLVERTAHHLSATLRLPLDWLNYSAPVCGGLIVLHSLRNLLSPREDGNE